MWWRIQEVGLLHHLLFIWIYDQDTESNCPSSLLPEILQLLLNNILDGNREAMLLCLVRSWSIASALEIILLRLQSFSLYPLKIWAIICEVHRTNIDGDCTAVKAKAQKVDSISVLMPFRKNIAVQQVVRSRADFLNLVHFLLSKGFHPQTDGHLFRRSCNSGQVAIIFVIIFTSFLFFFHSMLLWSVLSGPIDWSPNYIF